MNILVNSLDRGYWFLVEKERDVIWDDKENDILMNVVWKR